MAYFDPTKETELVMDASSLGLSAILMQTVPGSYFKLLSDCKAVELIFNNPKSNPPARIERWNLRLQGYNFEVKYMRGNENLSDYLSRHTSLRYDDKQGTMVEEYVNLLMLYTVPKALSSIPGNQTLSQSSCFVFTRP